jgi:hypothetical protein
LDRRRLMIFRPALVELRLRKPCLRFLRTFDGWYVLFDTAALLTERWRALAVFSR